MTIALLYRRQIKVDVAGFTISEPRIVVELERQIDSTQDRGEVSIYTTCGTSTKTSSGTEAGRSR